MVIDQDLWSYARAFMAVDKPFCNFLDLCNGDTSCMGKVYQYCFLAQEKIAEFASTRRMTGARSRTAGHLPASFTGELQDIFLKRWT